MSGSGPETGTQALTTASAQAQILVEPPQVILGRSAVARGVVILEVSGSQIASHTSLLVYRESSVFVSRRLISKVIRMRESLSIFEQHPA